MSDLMKIMTKAIVLHLDIFKTINLGNLKTHVNSLSERIKPIPDQLRNCFY